ncbi:MAG TPA: hypothetical protein VM939_10170 [Gemmatimonadaceae bacterium]|nr:hypothetical protein [Gemmatimonadaceae bacterium]
MIQEGDLTIRFTKGRDGPNTLSCVRPDGSTTWSKVSDFFPVHDLTHYVVETTLGLDDAVYGLIRSGWSISDFESPGAASRTPPGAILAEVMVGPLQREVLMRHGASAADYNQEVSAAMDGLGQSARRAVTADEFSTMQSRLRELMSEWKALPPGEAIQVHF